MRQEIEITLILEVDVNKSKQEIIDIITWKLDSINWLNLVNIKSIKEESELYEVKNELDYKELGKKFTEKLNSFSREEILEYLENNK